MGGIQVDRIDRETGTHADRKRVTERKTWSETDRQTDRQRHRDRDRQRQTDRDTETDRDREMEREETDRQTETDRKRQRQTETKCSGFDCLTRVCVWATAVISRSHCALSLKHLCSFVL